MLLILLGAGAVILTADLLIKQYVEENLKEGEERPIPGGKLVLRRVHNEGLMLNWLENRKNLAKYLSAAAFAVCSLGTGASLMRKGHWIQKTGFVCLTAGALSNLFDRFVRGYVVDYIAVRSKQRKLERITFNLGDIFIMAGAVITALTIGKNKRKHR